MADARQPDGSGRATDALRDGVEWDAAATLTRRAAPDDAYTNSEDAVLGRRIDGCAKLGGVDDCGRSVTNVGAVPVSADAYTGTVACSVFNTGLEGYYSSGTWDSRLDGAHDGKFGCG